MTLQSSAPTVTIGLPVFNGGEYLVEALDSILSQTYGHFELVISDNGSTDATEEICREYGRRDSRIRYYRRDINRGASWNFNEVVRLARAPFFKWAAHDDVLAPQFLERCVATLADAADDVVLCYPKTVLIDGAGTVIEEHDDHMDLRMSAPSARLEAMYEGYYLSNPIFGLLKTHVFRSTSLLRPFVSSDVVLLAEIALRGKVHEIPEPLFYRRFHSKMSRQAQANPVAAAAWFDPNNTDKPRLEWTRVFFETVRAIWTAPITVLEKGACTVSLVRSWRPKYFRRVRIEWVYRILEATNTRGMAQSARTALLNRRSA